MHFHQLSFYIVLTDFFLYSWSFPTRAYSTIYTFTESTDFSVTTSGVAHYLIVGGGGAGGNAGGDYRGAGGGGAGGVVVGSLNVTAYKSYEVIVGSGGVPSTLLCDGCAPGGNGGNSSFAGIIAFGGGGGGRTHGSGASGGSGGGPGDYAIANGRYYPGNGVVGQGHRGGYAKVAVGDNGGYRGAGGGGAGGVGGNGSSTAVFGGIGYTVSINDISQHYLRQGRRWRLTRVVKYTHCCYG